MSLLGKNLIYYLIKLRCVVYFGLHFFGELLPLTLLYIYQLRRCLKLNALRNHERNYYSIYSTIGSTIKSPKSKKKSTVSPDKIICDLTGYDQDVE